MDRTVRKIYVGVSCSRWKGFVRLIPIGNTRRRRRRFHCIDGIRRFLMQTSQINTQTAIRLLYGMTQTVADQLECISPRTEHNRIIIMSLVRKRHCVFTSVILAGLFRLFIIFNRLCAAGMVYLQIKQCDPCLSALRYTQYIKWHNFNLSFPITNYWSFLKTSATDPSRPRPRVPRPQIPVSGPRLSSRGLHLCVLITMQQGFNIVPKCVHSTHPFREEQSSLFVDDHTRVFGNVAIFD